MKRLDNVRFALRRCELREWRKDDERSLQSHADNPNVAQWLRDSFPQPYTIEDARIWLARNLDVPRQTQFAIVVDGEAAGGIGLYLQSDIFRRSAEIGYWLSEKHWGRGIMTEAVIQVTRFGFEHYDLAHVYAGVFEENIASARVLEKAAYRLEGRFRRHVTKRGVTMDDLIYGTIAPLQGAAAGAANADHP